MSKVMDFLKSFHPRKIGVRLILSAFLFLIFMFLDFTATESIARGDVGMEENKVLALWWNIFGSFRHIDIPIWIIYHFCLGYILNMKSEFLALWWLNSIAFGSMFGWISWLPTRAFDLILYPPIQNAILLDAVLPVTAFFLGLLLAILQIRVGQKT